MYRRTNRRAIEGSNMRNYREAARLLREAANILEGAGKRRKVRIGDRVRYVGNPTAALIYSYEVPSPGAIGTATEYSDPAGKLIWVEWNDGSAGSYYPQHLEVVE